MISPLRVTSVDLPQPPARTRRGDWLPWLLGCVVATLLASLALAHLRADGPQGLALALAHSGRACDLVSARGTFTAPGWQQGGRQLYRALCARAADAVVFGQTPQARGAGWVLMGWRDSSQLWHRGYVRVQLRDGGWVAVGATPTPPLPEVPTAPPLPEERSK